MPKHFLAEFLLISDRDTPGSPYIAAVSVAAMVGLWSAAALLNGDPTVLPGPWHVAPLMVQELISGELLRHLSATLLRVLAAFVIAMVIGTCIGLLMGRRKSVDRWLDPWLIVALNMPALVTIILCYLWIGLTEVAAVAAVALNKIPSVTVTIREGARGMSRQLDDLAQVFRTPKHTRFVHFVVPQLAPYLASAGRSGIALIWKIVLVVEFLGRGNGIGFKIHLYFQLFDVGMVLAYSLSFIGVMLIIETLFVRPWEARVSAWRHL